MHDLSEINAAVTAAVKKALTDAGAAVPMLEREVYENLPRPSAKVIFGKTRLERYNAATWTRTAEIIVAWNAPDPYTYKLACLAAEEIIERALALSGVRMPDGTLLPVDGLTGEIIDASVLVSFSVAETGEIETAEPVGLNMETLSDTYEVMEELN